MPNKSVTSVKSAKNKVLNKGNTKVIKNSKRKTNESITLVKKNKTKKLNKSVTSVKEIKNKISNKGNTKVVKEEKPETNKSITLVESNETKLLKNAEKFKALEEMLNMKNQIAEVIEWYEKKQKNVTEIPELRINAKALHGNIILKTFKLYEVAIVKITDFIKKHPQYKQQDIISQALIEFAERYHWKAHKIKNLF